MAASYWKSPYRENSHVSLSSDFGEKASLMLSVSSANSYGRIKHIGLASPQDWFDLALSVQMSSSKPKLALRQAGGKIKGILKTSGDSDAGSDILQISRESKSAFSSISDSTVSKREKKRVTFGAKDNDSDDHVSLGPRFKPERSMSEHRYRLAHSKPLDELSKQNLRKLLGYIPESTTLPPVSGKSVSSLSVDMDSGKNCKVTCRHNPDLKCAHCTNENEKKVESNPSNPQTENIPKKEAVKEIHNDKASRRPTPSGAKVKLMQSHLLPNKLRIPDKEENASDKEVKTDNQKDYSTHWTKSFIRSPLRRNGVRFIPGRYPLNVGNLHKSSLSFANNETRRFPLKSASAEDFTNLQVTGDGQVVKVQFHTKGEHPFKNESVSNSSTPQNSPRFRKSAPCGGRTGCKIQATPTYDHLPGTERGGSVPIPNSAPSRMRIADQPALQGVCVTGSNPQMEACLDKTSQILTWLQEVRQKSGLQPKRLRAHASEPQQPH